MATYVETLPPNLGITRIEIERLRAEVSIVRVTVLEWTTGLWTKDCEAEVPDNGNRYNIGPTHRNLFQPNPRGIPVALDAWWRWGHDKVLEIYRREISHERDLTAVRFYTGDRDEYSNTNLRFYYDRPNPLHGVQIEDSIINVDLPLPQYRT